MNEPASGAAALTAQSAPAAPEVVSSNLAPEVAAPTTTPAPVATPEPSGTWYDGVHEDHAGFFENKNFENLDAFAKSYKSLESMRGVPENEMLRIAKAEDADGMNAMYDRLGRPADAAGYTFEGMEDGGEWYNEAAFKAGLNQSQAEGIYNDFTAALAAAEEGQNTTYQESTQAQMLELKNEWGTAYDANMEYAAMAARKFGVNDDQLGAIEKAMGTKEMMNFMQKLGSATGEGTFVDGARPEGSLDGIMSTQAADAKRTALLADPAFKARLFSSDKAVRQAAMDERAALSKLAYDQGV